MSIDNESLPKIEPYISRLKIGEVTAGYNGRLQVYFGGNGIEHLSFYDHIELRDGEVQVDMYTIDGSKSVDYAVVRVLPPLARMEPLERRLLLAKAIRGMCGITKAQRTAQTPLQHFISDRIFVDIPISGYASYMAVSPQGEIYSDSVDAQDPNNSNRFSMFTNGWTFGWVAERGEPFVFGELCSPRFIDVLENIPIGDGGIMEIDDIRASQLPRYAIDRYMALVAQGSREAR